MRIIDMHSHTEETQHYVGKRSAAMKLATGLGWFSIGLGVLELIAGRALSKRLGMRGNEPLVRLYGLRELVTGLGILASRNPTPWIKARVAGDALDIGSLVPYLSRRNWRRENVKVALGNTVMVTALDVFCAQKLTEETRRARGMMLHDYSRRRGMPLSPDEMRGVARDFEVPRDMKAPESLQPYPEGQGLGKPRPITQPVHPRSFKEPVV